jgi:threonine dehydrogenase-like Zn-dependent dehydrogenase
MQAMGVCGTDLAMLSGARACRAQVLGHEGVGVVLSAPENSGISKGARVIINPVHRNRPELVIGHSRDGVFRELFWLNSSDALQGGHLVVCPEECSTGSAVLALTEPLASVLYSLERLREKRDATSLLIRGSGTVAILAAKVWSTFERYKTVLVSKSEMHAQWLRQAVRWPANATVETMKAIHSVTSSDLSEGFDSAILCCSREDAPLGLHFLLDSIRDGATIDLMAGFPPEYKEYRLGGVELDRIRWNNICGVQSAPPTTVTDHSTKKTLNLVGHRGTSERHILQAVEMLSSGAISLADIPHRKLTLRELPKAVSEMLSPDRHSMKWIKAIVALPQEILGDPHGRG